jgi:hypothetical protein
MVVPQPEAKSMMPDRATTATAHRTCLRFRLLETPELRKITKPSSPGTPTREAYRGGDPFWNGVGVIIWPVAPGPLVATVSCSVPLPCASKVKGGAEQVAPVGNPVHTKTLNTTLGIPPLICKGTVAACPGTTVGGVTGGVTTGTGFTVIATLGGFTEPENVVVLSVMVAVIEKVGLLANVKV